MLNDQQKKAVQKIHHCVDLSDVDGTWEHFVFRVEHVVWVRASGSDIYTKREAKTCQNWLRKFAPESPYVHNYLT